MHDTEHSIFGGGCCMTEIDECGCMCHEPNSSVMHIMPCCSLCPRCKRFIRIGWVETHKTNCPANKEYKVE